jgi:aspartyl-tRNA(Asn)/glutamyl-tRNA(Gln) amidotransferase subunit C
MKIDKETVDKIAHLARLKLTAEESAEMQVKMEQILTWMEKLNELDTTGVEPLIHMSVEINKLREDVVGEHIDHEAALKNAPSRDSDFFRVPKVIE